MGSEDGNNSQFEVWFPSDTYLLASSDRWYKVWTWAQASCDADGSGLFGSTAVSRMDFTTGSFVFEQST